MTSRPPDDPLELAELADHSRFVRNLALRLLRDDDAADEVVQETMLAAVKAKPSTGRSLRPWLATVARNVIRKRFRTTDRRRRRETAAARPERVASTAALAARAEILKRVVDAVLSLDEPNRSAVLLRYYEDLPPREIAKRLGVPVETVRGRLKRAAKQLRARLDASSPQGRDGWMPALAGLCGFEVPAEVATSGGGAATQTTGLSQSMATPGVAATVPALVGAFVLGGFAAGAVAWQGVSPPPAVSDGVDVGASVTRVEPASDAREARTIADAAPPDRFARARAKRVALRAERDRLEARWAALQPAPLDPSLFAFGWPADGTAFQTTDWLAVAKHVRSMSDLLPQTRAAVTAGDSMDPEVERILHRHNSAVVAFALTVAADLGTPHVNLAYSHPSVIANLVAALLELGGDPLTAQQRRQVRLLGEAWANETDPAPERSRDAPQLALMVEAVEARLRFVRALKTVLTPEQHRALFPPDLEDRVQLDLLSPAVVYALRRGVPAPDAASLRLEIIAKLLSLAQIRDKDPRLWSRVAEGWLDSLPGVYQPKPWYAIDLAFPPSQELQRLARAQLRATEAILASGRLDPDEAARLSDVTMLLVPQIPEARAAEGPTGD